MTHSKEETEAAQKIYTILYDHAFQTLDQINSETWRIMEICKKLYQKEEIKK